MPRDYAKYTAPQRRKTRPGYRVLFFSLLAALPIAAALFTLYSHTNADKTPQTAHNDAGAKKQAHASHKLKFDFYTLLSKRPPNPQLAARKTDSVENKPYTLQVAALRHKESVLQLKERLLLLGFEAFIVEHPESELKYRVNVGRYRRLAQAIAEQTRLSENNFSSIVIKRQITHRQKKYSG